MFGVEVVGLASSIISSIRILASLLRIRRHRDAVELHLLEDGENLAQALEEIMNDALKQENIDQAYLEEVQSNIQPLQEIRDSLFRYRKRSQLSTGIEQLHMIQQKLLKSANQIHERHKSPHDITEASIRKDANEPESTQHKEQLVMIAPGRYESTFTMLSAPDKVYTSTIIFVNSLNTDARKTWTSSGKDQLFWPRDLLVEDIDESAIGVYDYRYNIDINNDIEPDLGQDLQDIARQLQHTIERRTHGPLIWVAHSLGGLLVKTVLRMATIDANNKLETKFDKSSPIDSRTKGVIFIGTPHSSSSPGVRASRIGRILRTFSDGYLASRRSSELDELRLDSIITRATEHFATLIDQRGLSIASLYESEPVITESGPKMIVEEFARLHHQNEVIGNLPGNHMTMCKFGAKEENGYVMILNYLNSFNQRIKAAEPTQAVPPRSLSPTFSMVSSMTDTDTIDTGTLYVRLRLRMDVPISRWTSVRNDDLKEDFWFPTSEAFAKWVDSPKVEPLLIRGPNGSGKTMIAESILVYLRRRALSENLSCSICYLHLFLRFSSKEFQSPLALLATLIAQTLDQDSSLVRHFRKVPPGISKWTALTQAILRGVLKQMLEDPCWDKVYLVVDALDECDVPLIQPSFETIAWLLKNPKLRAVFTENTWNEKLYRIMVDKPAQRRIDLLTLLKPAVLEGTQEVQIIDLRSYRPWIDRLISYLDHELQSSSSKLYEVAASFSNHPRLHPSRIKDMLMGLPHLSYSVIDVALQHFTCGFGIPDERRRQLWINKNLEEDRRHRTGYDDLICMLRRQSQPAIDILSMLSCTFEPLKLSELCSLWETDETLSLHGEDHTLVPQQLHEFVTTGDMPYFVSISGDRLCLCSVAVKQVIHWQMKHQMTKTFESMELPTSTNRFLRSEHLHYLLARACLLMLQDNRSLPGKVYAERYWKAHTQQAGPKASKLNTLIKTHYRAELTSTNDNIQEPIGASMSKLFRDLVRHDLAVNLDSIFGVSIRRDSTILKPSDLDAVLAKTPTQETLAVLQQLNRLVNDLSFQTQERQSRLDIMMMIREEEYADLHNVMNSREIILEELMSLVRFAIDVGSIEAVGLLLSSIKDVRLGPNHSGSNLLTRAVLYQHTHMVQKMLFYQHLFDLNSALNAAVEAGNDVLCRNLLAHGADVNMKLKSEETLLHVAVTTNSTSLVTLLLQWNVSVMAKDIKGRTALFLASERGYTGIVQLLCQHSASWMVRDKDGRDPFFVACEEGHRETAALLWTSGAQMSKDNFGRSVVHAVAKSGQIAILEILIASGASIFHEDNLQITPLHEAAEQGWAVVVRRLVENGADIMSACLGQSTTLHFACTASNTPEEVLKLLLGLGANAKARDAIGRTPLLLAVQLSSVRVVMILSQFDRSLLYDVDDCGRGVWDYLHADDPPGLNTGKLKPKEYRERDIRKTSREEKRKYLKSLKLDREIHGETQNRWQALSVRELANKVRDGGL